MSGSSSSFARCGVRCQVNEAFIHLTNIFGSSPSLSARDNSADGPAAVLAIFPCHLCRCHQSSYIWPHHHPLVGSAIASRLSFLGISLHGNDTCTRGYRDTQQRYQRPGFFHGSRALSPRLLVVTPCRLHKSFGRNSDSHLCASLWATM